MKCNRHPLTPPLHTRGASMHRLAQNTTRRHSPLPASCGRSASSFIPRRLMSCESKAQDQRPASQTDLLSALVIGHVLPGYHRTRRGGLPSGERSPTMSDRTRPRAWVARGMTSVRGGTAGGRARSRPGGASANMGGCSDAQARRNAYRRQGGLVRRGTLPRDRGPSLAVRCDGSGTNR
jgi:hypothetical protein